MFVTAEALGIMYDFFLYNGKGSAGAENCSSEGSVMRLVKHLPQHKYHSLCFENWFQVHNQKFFRAGEVS